MIESILPFTFIKFMSTGIAVYPFTMMFIRLPFTIILISIRIQTFAIAIYCSVLKLTNICITIIKDEFSITMKFVIQTFSFIITTVVVMTTDNTWGLLCRRTISRRWFILFINIYNIGLIRCYSCKSSRYKTNLQR